MHWNYITWADIEMTSLISSSAAADHVVAASTPTSSLQAGRGTVRLRCAALRYGALREPPDARAALG